MVSLPVSPPEHVSVTAFSPTECKQSTLEHELEGALVVYLLCHLQRRLSAQSHGALVDAQVHERPARSHVALAHGVVQTRLSHAVNSVQLKTFIIDHCH